MADSLLNQINPYWRALIGCTAIITQQDPDGVVTVSVDTSGSTSPDWTNGAHQRFVVIEGVNPKRLTSCSPVGLTVVKVVPNTRFRTFWTKFHRRFEITIYSTSTCRHGYGSLGCGPHTEVVMNDAHPQLDGFIKALDTNVKKVIEDARPSSG